MFFNPLSGVPPLTRYPTGQGIMTVRQAAKALGLKRADLAKAVQSSGRQLLTSGAKRYVRVEDLQALFPGRLKVTE